MARLLERGWVAIEPLVSPDDLAMARPLERKWLAIAPLLDVEAADTVGFLLRLVSTFTRVG